MKTSELTGAALDWTVAKAEGKAPKVDCTSFKGTFNYCVYLGWSYEHSSSGSIIEYRPSKDWARGGPIIEREMISVWPWDDVTWKAEAARDAIVFEGPTPLIAAMRCFVASKLGDVVDVPKELA